LNNFYCVLGFWTHKALYGVEALSYCTIAAAVIDPKWLAGIVNGWKKAWLGYSLIASCFLLFAWFSWHLPPSGYGVVVMTVVAGIMAIRPEMGGWERSLWFVLLVCFSIIEIRAINHDREQAKDEFTEITAGLKTSVDQGKVAVNGLQTTIKEGREHFDATVTGLEKNLRATTGGDSYCYAVFGNESPDHRTKLLFVIHRGSFPLRNAHLRLVDQMKASELAKEFGPSLSVLQQSETNYSLGDIGNGQSETLAWVDLSGRDHINYLADFSALNGNWYELIRLRLTKGGWQQAYKVSKWIVVDKKKPAQEKILYAPSPPREYPLVNGKVDW
jgi:hypothetical protein